jgi:hypothetical protein
VLIVQLLVTVAVTLRFAVAVAAVAFVEPNPANAIPAAAIIPANLIDRFTSVSLAAVPLLNTLWLNCLLNEPS